MKNEYLYPLIKIGGLWAPFRYFTCPWLERERFLNGCGPGGWIVDLIPDTMYGMPVHAACDIHDWFYKYGQTWRDKKIADGLFYRNLKTIVKENTKNNILLNLRLHRAKTYYEAVHKFGNDAFWGRKLDV